MILKLQIALTILSCLFVAAVFPVATWLSFDWGVATALGALLCFGGVLLCKRHTQAGEQTEETSEELEVLGQDEPLEQNSSAEEEETKDSKKINLSKKEEKEDS